MAINSTGFDLRVFHPISPDISNIAVADVRFSYWHDIDTPMINFGDPAEPSVVVPIEPDHVNGEILPDGAPLLVHAVTEAVVGVQIEAFLVRTAPRHPHLLDMLDLAELHGIAPGEVADLRRELAVGRKPSAIAAIFDEFVPSGA